MNTYEMVFIYNNLLHIPTTHVPIARDVIPRIKIKNVVKLWK